MKADGAVLVINQNGIVFGAGSQINVRGLITTSLELGPTSRQVNNQYVLSTLKQRNDIFLALGLLGGADAYALANPSQTPQVVFGSQGVPIGSSPPAAAESLLEGGITIEAGANLPAPAGGLLARKSVG